MHIGIDIGGTYVRVIALPSLRLTSRAARFAVRQNGRQAVRQRLPRTKEGLEKTLEEMIGKVSRGKKTSSIGIGLPGVLDYKKGVLVKAGNLPFLKNWNAKKFLLRFRAPVFIDNDSRCFLRAEARYGAGRGYKNIVGVAIGTGIGGGILVNGELYYGANNRAGEVGHTAMRIANGKGQVIKTLEQLGAKRAFEKYGDRSVIIGIGVANIVNILDPECVVLGGGAITGHSVNMSAVRKTARRFIISPAAQGTPILATELGEYGGALGAVLLLSPSRSSR